MEQAVRTIPRFPHLSDLFDVICQSTVEHVELVELVEYYSESFAVSNEHILDLSNFHTQNRSLLPMMDARSAVS